jgi:putative sigma-54 modulation protein
VRTIVKGKNMDVSESVREYAERKLRRLERLLDESTDAVVELSHEPHRGAESQIAEVVLIVAGQPLRSHASGPTHQACLDTVVDKLERQAVSAREKPRGRVRMEEARGRRAGGRAIASLTDSGGQTEAAAADRTPATEAASRIVKTKRFAIEPMFEEDALARIEELGHQFFIFVNAETERLCVLYKRHAGDYGLIEPVIGGVYTPGQLAPKGNGRRES